MKNTISIILLILIFSKFSFGQTYTYTRQPIRFDKAEDRFRLIYIETDFHLWKINKKQTSFSVFDKNMKTVNSITFPKKLDRRLTFINFTGFYFLFFLENNLLHTFQIDKSGNIKDRSEEIRRKLNNNATGFFFAQKINEHIYLAHSTSSKKNSSSYALVSIDSNLTVLNRASLTLDNEKHKSYTINFFPASDSVVYFARHSHEYKKPSTLLFAKINTMTEYVLAETFTSKDTNYLMATIVEGVGQDIILHNRVSVKNRQPGQALYNSQFIRFDKNFEMTKSEYFDTFLVNDSLNMSESGFWPVKIMRLNNSEILSINYGVSSPSLTEVDRPGGENVLSHALHNKPDYLRFIYLDSALRIKKSFFKESTKGGYYPSLMLSSGDNLFFLYARIIDRKWTSLHGYQLTDTIENNFELHVVPSYDYYLHNGIQIDRSSFVIPYINNGELGLVKIVVRDLE